MSSKPQKGVPSKVSHSFSSGLIALVFLIIGYQFALFVHNSRILRLASKLEAVDTVYLYDTAVSIAHNSANERKASSHVYKKKTPGKRHVDKTVRQSSNSDSLRKMIPRSYRRTETFRFNPNEASEQDFIRLGFTESQAASLVKYRLSGGCFRRKEDFAKSYVVADSVYQRLKDFIDLPLLDLNLADSLQLDQLPGIGKVLASRIIAERERLGGFSSKEQLLFIYGIDKEKYDKLSDLITVDSNVSRPLHLWTMSADSLKLHPYIRNWKTAKAVVLYRDNSDKSAWTLEALLSAGILTKEQYEKLSFCRIALP